MASKIFDMKVVLSLVTGMLLNTTLDEYNELLKFFYRDTAVYMPTNMAELTFNCQQILREQTPYFNDVSWKLDVAELKGNLELVPVDSRFEIIANWLEGQCKKLGAHHMSILVEK